MGKLMQSSLWLRIASLICLSFAAGHALGATKNWSPMGDNPVLQSMRATHFETLKVNRSYFDFYMGFGHTLTVMLVMLTLLLWQLATVAHTNFRLAKPMIVVIGLAMAANGIIAWQFIFPVPALLSAVLVACLAVAYFAPQIDT
jgi:hypothetical protein